MTTGLIKYDAACIAIREAAHVDEVLEIKNQAEAMRIYAKQAKNMEMANQAAEIRIRAERRYGMMRMEAPKNKGGKAEHKSYRFHDETGKIPTLSEMGVSKMFDHRAKVIASVPEAEFEAAITEHREQQKELTSSTIRALTEKGKAHVSHNSGENEWYTPAQYIEAARQVMGGIDLDPASSDLANRTVGADAYYTKEESGLDKPWGGRVWMNPPYAQPLISRFTEKLTASCESGDVSQAIVLVNNATDTAWFQLMARVSSAICFPKSRIKFLDQEGRPGAPLQGQAILYMGSNKSGFVSSFQQFGFVLANV